MPKILPDNVQEQEVKFIIDQMRKLRKEIEVKLKEEPTDQAGSSTSK